jgi:hypothetical protein
MMAPELSNSLLNLLLKIDTNIRSEKENPMDHIFNKTKWQGISKDPTYG